MTSRKTRAAAGPLRPASRGPIAAGPATRDRLGRLLGVAALERKGHRVVAASWAPDMVQVQVTTPEGSDVVLGATAATEGRPSFLRCGALDLAYRGQSLDGLLEGALRAVAPRGLGRHTVESLGALFAADPEAGRLTEPLPHLPESDQRGFDEAALLFTWGSPAVWGQFFAVAEVARAQLDSLDYWSSCLFVQHSDLECVYIAPQTGVPMVPLVLYPWEDRVRQIDWRRPGSRRPPEPEGMALLTTDLDEGAVILGEGPRRLEAALTEACRRAGDRMVFCSNTCVPVVAGEDSESVVERAGQGFDGTLLSLTTTPQSMEGLLGELLVDVRLDAEGQAPPPDPRAVNLVGFADDPATEELVSLLAGAEVRVEARLLPALSPSILRQLPAASLNVMCPNALWQPHYDLLRVGSRTPSIQPPAPYGSAATEGWVRRVAEEVGGDPSGGRELAARAAALAPDLDRLRTEARRHRLAVVVRAEDAHRVASPAGAWGIDLPEMLAELGFGLEVLLVASRSRELTERAEAQLAEAIGQRGSLRSIGEAAQLRRALEGGELSAVLSEQLYDRRLTEMGLAPFSLQCFEPGLEGALRTGRRLLELCEAPFFRRYGSAIAASARRRGLPDPLGGISLERSPRGGHNREP